MADAERCPSREDPLAGSRRSRGGFASLSFIVTTSWPAAAACARLCHVLAQLSHHARASARVLGAAHFRASQRPRSARDPPYAATMRHVEGQELNLRCSSGAARRPGPRSDGPPTATAGEFVPKSPAPATWRRFLMIDGRALLFRGRGCRPAAFLQTRGDPQSRPRPRQRLLGGVTGRSAARRGAVHQGVQPSCKG